MGRLRNTLVGSFCLSALACAPAETVTRIAPAEPRQQAPRPQRKVITIVGTNDLHGRLHALPLLAGYVDRLRALRKDDGGVLLVDAGDMFQGTLESNLNEGMAVVKSYAALGYAAVAIGNHEFDFGPVGPSPVPVSSSDDPLGALKRVAEAAPFPFLLANARERKTGALWQSRNLQATSTVNVAGLRIGIVGVTTEDTPRTTIATNVEGLAFESPSQAVERSARELRGSGVEAVVVLAHAGGKCKRFGSSPEVDECLADSEVFRLAQAIPAELVDAIVAGHTHAGVAHTVNGIPISESFAYGKAFGRIDLTFEGNRIVDRRTHPPQDLCVGNAATCETGQYEGEAIGRSAKIAEVTEPYIAAASAKRQTAVGPKLLGVFHRSYEDESPLGNLFSDLMHERWAAPKRSGVPVAVALFNGGGLRADLPPGPLQYGSFFEAFPFDNRIARASVDGRLLKDLLASHAVSKVGGILSISGITVSVGCAGGQPVVTLSRADGREVRDTDAIEIIASDFLLLGGDSFWGSATPPPIKVENELVRDGMEAVLAARTNLSPEAHFNPQKLRFRLPARRPLACPLHVGP